MNQRFLFLLGALACALPAKAANLHGLWEFDNPANLGEAAVGNPLVIGGTHAHHASLADDGGTVVNGVVTTQGGTTGYFTATPDIPANGGGVFVNQYTIVTDVFTPVGSRGTWRPIFQTNAAPDGNDSDYWIRNSDNHVGVGELGYSDAPIDDTRWTRLVITVDLTKFGGDVETYVDGALFYTHPTDQAVDGRHSLYPLGDQNVMHFFSDNDDDQNPPMNVGVIAVYDGVLSAAEIALLGVAGDPIQAPPSRELRWTGATSEFWSANVLASPKNWVLADDGVTEADFMDFDNVTFDDSSTVTGICIEDGDVTPGDILFDIETRDYLLDGANGILDPATLTKRGAATLTLETDNSFRGATHLEGGTIVLGEEFALQNSPLTINAGTSLEFTTFAATIGGLSGDQDLPLETSFGVPQPTALRVNGGGTYSGSLSSSGSLTKGGGGILSLSSSSTYTGGTTVESGRLQIESPGGLGPGTVSLTGGALGFSFGNGSSESFSNDIVLGPTGQATFVIKGDSGANINVATTVELTGLITGGAPGEVFRFLDTDQGGNHLNVIVPSNPANDFQGVVQMWRGTLGITSDDALGHPDNDIQHYTENLNGAIRFDAPGITLNASRDINFPGAVNPRPINTQGFDAEIAGALTGTANLVKQGSGTLTLSGTTLFGGAVEVAEGTLALAGAADLGSVSAVNVSFVGTLDLTALGPGFTLFANLTGDGMVLGEFTTFGIVSPGSADGLIGTLTTETITLDFFLNMEFDSDFLDADHLKVNGDLNITPNAELILIDLAPVPAALPAGTKVALIEYTGSWDGGTFQYFDLASLVNLPDGGTLTLGPNTFVIDYDDTTDGVNPGQFVTLTVQGGGGAFATWAAGQGLDGSPGKEAGFGDDPERDLVPNGLEWILGGGGLTPDASAILPDATGDAVNGLTLTFTREEDSIGEATLLVQWNTDLGPAWNDVPVGAASSVPDANGVTVTVNAVADPDEITVRIPATNAVDGEIFARLTATMP